MLYNKLKMMWNHYYENTSLTQSEPPNWSMYVPLLNFARISQMIFAVYDFKAFKSEFISDNIDEILGISLKDYNEKRGAYFIKNIPDDHKNSNLVLSQILLEYLPQQRENISKYSTVSCGIKYLHPQKGIIRLLMKQCSTELDGNNLPVKALFTVQDITHLLKDDFYWISFHCESDKQEMQMHYRSDTGEKHNSNIISRREKEILILLAQGQETNEIAESLYISRNTVNNHRQNMLNRLGIKDTIALVHLAKLCELI